MAIRLSVVVPVVGTASYVLPAASVEAVVLVAAVALDKAGLYKYARDVVVVSEGKSFSLSRSLSDTTPVSDTSSLSLELPRADSVSSSDTTTTEAQKGLFDATSVDSAQAYSFTRGAETDSVSPSDTDVYVFGKGLFETPTITEAARYGLARPLADSYGVSDASSNVFSTSRADEAAIGDIFDKQLTYQRSLSDAFGLNDNFGAGDGIAFVWERVIANVAIMGDNSAIALQYGKSDGTVIVESGSLVSQGYCDPTYFAEDYVGDSRSF
jgi:hypothetical protein